MLLLPLLLTEPYASVNSLTRKISRKILDLTLTNFPPLFAVIMNKRNASWYFQCYKNMKVLLLGLMFCSTGQLLFSWFRVFIVNSFRVSLTAGRQLEKKRGKNKKELTMWFSDDALTVTWLRYFRDYLTLFRMGFFGAAHRWLWVIGGGGGKKAPLPKICHTYPTMMKLGSYALPQEDPIYIWITWHTPWVLLISPFFYLKINKFYYIKKYKYRLHFDT